MRAFSVIEEPKAYDRYRTRDRRHPGRVMRAGVRQGVTVRNHFKV
jgi:hypothetical protein